MKRLLILIMACILVGCSKSSEPANNFNFVFSYGGMNKNILDTFEGKYTKDLVANGSVTTDLVLTREEMEVIYSYMNDINFFQFPERVEGLNMLPSSGYTFEVEFDGKRKVVNWIGEFSESKRDLEFKGLTYKVIEIIMSKKEYKDLPDAKGFYE